MHWCYIWCVNEMMLHMVCECTDATYGVWMKWCYIWCVNALMLHMVREWNDVTYGVWMKWCYIWCVNEMMLHMVCEWNDVTYGVWMHWCYIWCVNEMMLHMVCECTDATYGVWMKWCYIWCVNEMMLWSIYGHSSISAFTHCILYICRPHGTVECYKRKMWWQQLKLTCRKKSQCSQNFSLQRTILSLYDIMNNVADFSKVYIYMQPHLHVAYMDN